MTRSSIKMTACAIAAAAFLTACGGGGTTPDTTAPTVTITDNVSGTANGDVTFTFTFSEVVTGFEASDVTVTNGTPGTFSMGSDGMSATLVVTPTANTTGTIEVSIATSSFADTSGNNNSVSANASQAFNTSTTNPNPPSTANIATFDEGNPPTVTAFGGATGVIEAAPSGGNGNALKVTRNGGEVWAGAWLAIPAIPSNAGTQVVSARVYSPTAGVPIVAKAEYGDNTGTGDVQATETVVAGWQTLTWRLTNLDPARTYDRFVVLPQLGTVGSGQSFIFDDISVAAVTSNGGGSSSAGGLTLVTFDETPAATLDAFEGASFAADTDGTNKIAKFTKPTTAQPWGGATFTSCPTGTLGAMPPIPFTSNLQTISVRVKAPRAGVMFSLEVKDKFNPGNLVFAQTSNVGTDWETLSFNFTNKTFGLALDTSTTYNQLSIFPNFDKANESSAAKETTDSVYYFDDVKLVGSTATLGTCPAAPVSTSPINAPAAPTENAANVISIYSGAYTATPGVNLNPNWGQNTVQSVETIAGNEVMKLATFNYQGIDFDANPIDVTAKTSLHVDMWSANATTVNVFLIGPGAGNEQAYPVTLNANAWTSVDIPLSSYSNVTGKNAIRQLKLVSDPANTTVFVDNVYFK